jgi:hypothetical protein
VIAHGVNDPKSKIVHRSESKCVPGATPDDVADMTIESEPARQRSDLPVPSKVESSRSACSEDEDRHGNNPNDGQHADHRVRAWQPVAVGQ